MSRIHFYATANDISMICQVVESKMNLKIYPSFTVLKEDFSGEVTEYESFADIPNLGKATSGDCFFNPTYVLIDKAIPLQPGVRRAGELEKIYMSATLHEAAVDFTPGGEFGDDAIILGEMLNQMSSKESERILRAFRTAMKKHFGVRARGMWIGPETLERLKTGTRVTAFYDHPEPEIVDIQLHEIEPQEAITSG